MWMNSNKIAKIKEFSLSKYIILWGKMKTPDDGDTVGLWNVCWLNNLTPLLAQRDFIEYFRSEVFKTQLFGFKAGGTCTNH